MQRSGAENIVRYYRAIPGMKKLLHQERSELETEYDSLRGTTLDGLPRATAPGMPTEAHALQLADSGIYERLQEIAVRVQVLDADAATIRDALDGLSGKYKRLLTMRLLRGYSWARIGITLHAADSTVRFWYNKALDQMANTLDDAPMPDELEARASRARSL